MYEEGQGKVHIYLLGWRCAKLEKGSSLKDTLSLKENYNKNFYKFGFFIVFLVLKQVRTVCIYKTGGDC